MRLRNIPAAQPAIDASPYCITDEHAADYKGNWQSLFPKEQPIHMEIGMGKGRFIMNLARQNPDINYLGVERYASVLYRGLQKYEAEEQPLTNLRFLCIDAGKLPEYFAPGEVHRIYLNFSDPWPKDRHAKRRLTSSNFLAKYDEILTQDGRIEFKTDNMGLFDFSVEEMQASPIFQIQEMTRDLHHDNHMNQGNIMTEYEEKFSSKGNPIYKFIAIRR